MCTMITPNNYTGTDSERIEQAMAAVKAAGGSTLVIPRRVDKDGRDWWSLDRAILLDGGTTLILDNAVLKLSDRCRDNAIRSANCGLGIKVVKPLKNIHVKGIGTAIIRGADNPRATGDGAKTLGVRSYGTDAGKEGECQKGDWRNIGILMAHVDGFSVDNITMEDSHCWAISFERCSNGRVSNISFNSHGYRIINGKRETVLNQDGIDLRMGCHDIIIENIRGVTGDDMVALTGIRGNSEPGMEGVTVVSGSKPTDDDDIRNVIIRNVMGYSYCQIVRFLNTGGVKLYNVKLDTLIDTSPKGHQSIVALRIGDSVAAWGGVTPLGDTFGIIVNNVQSRARDCILIKGSLCDSVLSNILNFNPKCPTVRYASGTQNTRNVIVK